MHLAVLVDDRDPRPFGAEQHGVHRDRNPRNRSPGRKMHLAKRTRQQLAVFVRNIHFRVQGARRGIDGISGASYRSQKFLAGKFLQRDGGLHPDFHVRRIRLRHADVNAKRIDARNIEQLFAGTLPPGIDECTGINIAPGKHAGKRSVHVLERLEFFQAANIRVPRCQVGECLLVAACLLVGFLLGNRVGLAQVCPAVSGDLRQPQRRFDLLAAGSGLGKLLVDFWSVNRRQQFSLLNLASHVLVPA